MGTVEQLKNETPPTETTASRDAIKACMDNVTGKLCSEIERVRRMLDELSSIQVERAGRVKKQLDDFVDGTEKLKSEVQRLEQVTDDLRAEHARIVSGRRAETS